MAYPYLAEILCFARRETSRAVVYAKVQQNGFKFKRNCLLLKHKCTSHLFMDIQCNNGSVDAHVTRNKYLSNFVSCKKRICNLITKNANLLSCVSSRRLHTNSKQEPERDEEQIQSKILTIPNVLTVTRMVLAPVLGYLVVQQSYTTALSVFVFAGFTDLFDGLIARNFKSQTSHLGSLIDPLADKLLVSILFISLTYVNLIPASLMALVISRDTLLMSAGFYVRFVTLNPRPTSIKEYFDPTNHPVKLQPTACSKLNTAVQLSLVAITLASPVFGYVDHQFIHYLWFLTATTTIASGIGYIFAKDTIKHVGKSYVKKIKN